MSEQDGIAESRHTGETPAPAAEATGVAVNAAPVEAPPQRTVVDIPGASLAQLKPLAPGSYRLQNPGGVRFLFIGTSAEQPAVVRIKTPFANASGNPEAGDYSIGQTGRMFVQFGPWPDAHVAPVIELDILGEGLKAIAIVD